MSEHDNGKPAENPFPEFPADKIDHIYDFHGSWNTPAQLVPKVDRMRAVLHEAGLPADGETAIVLLTLGALLLRKLQGGDAGTLRIPAPDDIEDLDDIPLPPNATRH